MELHVHFLIIKSRSNFAFLAMIEQGAGMND
jgi:hypothetical protein